MIDYFLVMIALAYVIIATIFDIKTKEVPDWLSFSLIAIALFVNFLYSIMFNQWNYIIYSLAGLVIFFLFGSLMYYARQWGGGDAKLLMGIGALLPQYPLSLINYFNPALNMPFLLILVINILVVGGIYGLIYSIVLAVRHKKQFIKEFNLLIKKYGKKLNILFIILLVLIILLFLLDLLLMVPFLLLILLIIFIYLFIKSVENSSMYKMVSVNKLSEGDWVVQTIKSRNKVIYREKPFGVAKQDIINIKKSGVKMVLVKQGLPFVPAFLMGLVISLTYGNLFLMLI